MQDTPQQELHNDKAAYASHLLTPHELVHRHMANPDELITDEDMKNLNLEVSTQLTPDKKAEADNEADILSKDNTGTAYDVSE